MSILALANTIDQPTARSWERDCMSYGSGRRSAWGNVARGLPGQPRQLPGSSRPTSRQAAAGARRWPARGSVKMPDKDSEQAVLEGVPKDLYIGGQWRAARSGGTLSVEDPSTGEI